MRIPIHNDEFQIKSNSKLEMCKVFNVNMKQPEYVMERFFNSETESMQVIRAVKDFTATLSHTRFLKVRLKTQTDHDIHIYVFCSCYKSVIHTLYKKRQRYENDMNLVSIPALKHRPKSHTSQDTQNSIVLHHLVISRSSQEQSPRLVVGAVGHPWVRGGPLW